ncbi:DUF2141 domain-containing protein [uncultured Sphingomonas sp.]|uniref:DUF2141 domain-containing protein n=1 Tax=uncultured Sphingomonas sp. TaxID=158754 RepID=UPI0035CB9266
MLGATAAFLMLGAATPVGRLDVAVAGLRSSNGVIRLCLTANPKAFPACHNDALAVRRNAPAGAPLLQFDGLPPGDYAAAVMHDENGNKRLDTFAGIPREGFGFSRNPVVRFGPPRFAAARFTIVGAANAQQVRMRYMF